MLFRSFEGSENYTRDFISVDEVIDYHMRFLEIKESGIFNIGRGNTLSFLDIARHIAKKYHCDIQYIPMPENLKLSYQKFTCANMSKTNSVCEKYYHKYDARTAQNVTESETKR